MSKGKAKNYMRNECDVTSDTGCRSHARDRECWCGMCNQVDGSIPNFNMCKLSERPRSEEICQIHGVLVQVSLK